MTPTYAAAWPGRIERLARVGLCLAFAWSGVAKLLDFPAAVDETARMGLAPAWLFAALTIATQLGGSLLVIVAGGWAAAIGALALAGFTLLATFIGHPFWRETGAAHFADLNAFLEHFGLIGGFLLVALAEWRREPRRSALTQ